MRLKLPKIIILFVHFIHIILQSIYFFFVNLDIFNGRAILQFFYLGLQVLDFLGFELSCCALGCMCLVIFYDNSLKFFVWKLIHIVYIEFQNLSWWCFFRLSLLWYCCSCSCSWLLLLFLNRLFLLICDGWFGLGCWLNYRWFSIWWVIRYSFVFFATFRIIIGIFTSFVKLWFHLSLSFFHFRLHFGRKAVKWIHI